MSRSCPMSNRRRQVSKTAHQFLRRRTITIGCPGTGSTRPTTTIGSPAIGASTRKTALGSLLTMSIRHRAAFMSAATGTMCSPCVANCMRQCISAVQSWRIDRIAHYARITCSCTYSFLGTTGITFLVTITALAIVTAAGTHFSSTATHHGVMIRCTPITIPTMPVAVSIATRGCEVGMTTIHGTPIIGHQEPGRRRSRSPQVFHRINTTHVPY